MDDCVDADRIGFPNRLHGSFSESTDNLQTATAIILATLYDPRFRILAIRYSFLCASSDIAFTSPFRTGTTFWSTIHILSFHIRSMARTLFDIHGADTLCARYVGRGFTEHGNCLYHYIPYGRIFTDT